MPTTELLQVMDRELEVQINAVHTRINAESELILFTNNRQPEPDDVAGDYTQPVYAEYSPVDLTGEWTTPARDEAVVWTTQTEIYSFDPPTSGGDVTIYGFAVFKDDDPIWALLLETPVVLTVGGDPYRLRVYYSQYSGLVHAERVCT